MLRYYWQALEDAAYGPLDPSRLHPVLDARNAAYLASGINAAEPTAVKNFLGARRDYIFWLLQQADVDFAITTHGGVDYTSSSTLVTLEGTASISAREITINGVAYPITWSTITNWSTQVPLSGQTNHLVVQGYDADGNPLGDATTAMTIYFDGPVSRLEDSLVINEIMYNPAVTNAEYVEIYNRSTNTTFGLADFRLKGVDFNFGPGTIIGPQEFLMVVKDTVAFQTAYGTGPRIAGEFNGNLDPDGERLTLLQRAPTTNETDIVIDQVKFRAEPPWPAGPATPGAGKSLQLIDAAQDNSRVSNWDDGSAWHFFSFTGKPSGTRIYLYLDAAGDIYIDDMTLVPGSVPGVGDNAVRNGEFELPLGSDWGVLGSNGAEGSAVSTALAHSGASSLHLVFARSGSTSRCLYQDVTTINTANTYTLSFWYRSNPGSTANTLTVRLGVGSFLSELDARPAYATPGEANWGTGTLPAYPLVWINEVQPDNPDGLVDNSGTPQPWIELYNSSTNILSLDGFFLSATYDPLNEWAFPAGTLINPGEFRIIFADGQPELSTESVLHTSFRLDPVNGSVALSRGQLIVDYLNYTNMSPGLSFGAYPDGQLFDQQLFYFVTPGAANNPAPVPVVINEWMASNTRTLLDPLTQRYDDWFELYNFGSLTLNLSGFYLTDSLNNEKEWRIPEGVTLAPNSFLLCWADNDNSGTNMMGNALHTSFKISKSGDEIGLFSPEGVNVDTVIFGSQIADVSQGRFHDGNLTGGFQFMTTPTPGTSNIVTGNVYAPTLGPILDRSVNEGQLLSFTVFATDGDVPAQPLTFSLMAGAPYGAAIDPATGGFTWTPIESQGGVDYSITVAVTDNGEPALNDTQTFTVTVNEVNNPPVIDPMADQSVSVGTLVSLTIPVIDTDLPAQTFTYSLVSGPAGASVSPAGVFTWTPGSGQGPSTNGVLVSATDSGVPSLSATQSFTVVVSGGSSCSGLMADAAPRPNGNGAISISDWVQVGRFAAGLDTTTDPCEFSRVDCAPKPSGNGSITISDWVQAGRYAAGLDPAVPVGGSAPGFAPLLLDPGAGASSTKGFAPQQQRVITVANMNIGSGQSNCLQILLEAQGDENALSFSLNFDPELLTFLSATKGSDASNATVIVNTAHADSGAVGLLIALPFGTAFTTGTHVIAEVCFQAAEVSETASTSVTMGDFPIGREVSDSFANILEATYENATVTITSGVMFQEVAPLPEGGVKLILFGEPGAVWELQSSADLEHWDPLTTVTNTTGTVEYIDADAINANPRFYRAVSQ